MPETHAVGQERERKRERERQVGRYVPLASDTCATITQRLFSWPQVEGVAALGAHGRCKLFRADTHTHSHTHARTRAHIRWQFA